VIGIEPTLAGFNGFRCHNLQHTHINTNCIFYTDCMITMSQHTMYTKQHDYNVAADGISPVHDGLVAAPPPSPRPVLLKIGDGILAIHNGLTPTPRCPVSSKNDEILRGYNDVVQAPAHPSSSKISDGISAPYNDDGISTPQRSRSRHLTTATSVLFQFCQRS
jgi:hypothetical protein